MTGVRSYMYIRDDTNHMTIGRYYDAVPIGPDCIYFTSRMLTEIPIGITLERSQSMININCYGVNLSLFLYHKLRQ